MQKIKIGVLGCAEIAQRLMIPAIIKHPDFELVSIASRSPKKVKRIISSHNYKAKAENAIPKVIKRIMPYVGAIPRIS